MKNPKYLPLAAKILFLILVLLPLLIFSQEVPEKRNEFWNKVQFGGGVGLSIGSGYTDVTLAPVAIYNFNQYVAAGVGLQGSYVSARNFYKAGVYGGSLIGIFNPIEQLQLSAELEEVRVNRTFQVLGARDIKDNFWSTGLFLGAGYRTGNVIMGIRYNVLFKENDYVYNDALMPFIRVYF